MSKVLNCTPSLSKRASSCFVKPQRGASFVPLMNAITGAADTNCDKRACRASLLSAGTAAAAAAAAGVADAAAAVADAAAEEEEEAADAVAAVAEAEAVAVAAAARACFVTSAVSSTALAPSSDATTAPLRSSTLVGTDCTGYSSVTSDTASASICNTKRERGKTERRLE